MAKYIDAERLKAEIERLKSKYRHNDLWTSSFQSDLAMAKIESMNEILSFLDTLEEPVSDCHDLEEAAEKSSAQYYKDAGYSPFPNVETAAHKSGFIAGAEWMKAKMLKDNPVIMSVEDFQALIDSHAKRVEADYKEKMMEGAVECVVCAGMEGDKWIMTYIGSYESMLKTCKAGDKVKIIIVKEEE